MPRVHWRECCCKHALPIQTAQRCRDKAWSEQSECLNHAGRAACCHTCFAASYGTPCSTSATCLGPPCRDRGSVSGLAEPVPARSCGSAAACGVRCSASLVLPRHARLLALCILSAFAHLHTEHVRFDSALDSSYQCSQGAASTGPGSIPCGNKLILWPSGRFQQGKGCPPSQGAYGPWPFGTHLRVQLGVYSGRCMLACQLSPLPFRKSSP